MKFIISINVSNLCTENCKICPHSISDDELKNNLFYDFKYNTSSNTPALMRLNTMKKLVFRINEFLLSDESKKYDEIILSITGFGEPLMNPDVIKFINKLSYLKSNYKNLSVNIITNAITAYKMNDEKLLKNLIDNSGKDSYTVKISIHDFNSKYMNDIRLLTYNKLNNGVEIRNHDFSTDINELIINNRGGLMKKLNKPSSLTRQCWYPLYEISIDTNGDFLICAHDWSRYSRMDKINIFELSIIEYLKSDKMKFIKNELSEKGNRNAIPSCKNCTVNGMINGYDNYIFNKHESDKK